MRKKQYKETKVKDRRSIVRALNTFSEQYDYIYCDTNTKGRLNLDTKRLTLVFSNTLSVYMSNIVFSKSNAKIELSKYINIINTIDNLISINRKLELKKRLKVLVESTVQNKSFEKNESNYISVFFDSNKKENIITQISYLVDNNITFAMKLYNQIKNRIQYKNLDLYKNNSITKINANSINITYLSQQDLFYNKINFIKQHLWLFSEVQMNTLRKGIEKGNYDFLKDEHDDIIANEWIEHYENISSEKSDFIQYIHPRIIEDLTDIFNQYEFLRFNNIYTKKGNIVQFNKYIQNIKSGILKNVKKDFQKIKNDILEKKKEEKEKAKKEKAEKKKAGQESQIDSKNEKTIYYLKKIEDKEEIVVEQNVELIKQEEKNEEIKIVNKIYRDLKKLWISINDTLTDKFHIELMYIYYMDIDDFKYYDGNGLTPIQLYAGDFQAELYYPTPIKEKKKKLPKKVLPF